MPESLEFCTTASLSATGQPNEPEAKLRLPDGAAMPGEGDATVIGIEELIVFDVERTADWRRQKAEEFANDNRNTHAAEILERLAVELRALEGTALHIRLAGAIDQLVEDAAFAPILSDGLRAVGFRSFPSSGKEFLAELVSDLEQELAIQRLDIEGHDGLDELHTGKAERERLLLELE